MKNAFLKLAQEKREAILNAAFAEFGANDFDAASLDRIVAAAGISKGGLYEYIASKEDLYLHCVEEAWARLYRYIKEAAAAAGEPLPGDILERFFGVAKIAIGWYLKNPSLLALIVRIARLPRDGLAAQAKSIFERHFAGVFSGLDAARLAYPEEQLVDLVKWLLAKTRRDVLFEIAVGKSEGEVRAAYLAEWEFFCAVLKSGIYKPPA
jgi:AcrR family transcriptional regulator